MELAVLVTECYPEHKWDMRKLIRHAKPIKSSQQLLCKIVKELLPTEGKVVAYYFNFKL